MSPRATAVASTAPEPVTIPTPPLLSGYHGLKVWQRAMDLAAAVHLLTKALPASEETLRAELRRAAFAVPTQIAAGNSLYQRAEYVQHLSDAVGAVARVECLLQAADRVGVLPSQEVMPLMLLAVEVGRMLRGLTRSLVTKRTRDAEPAETVN